MHDGSYTFQTSTMMIMMAYAKSSLDIEIQKLKGELAAAQNKVDRYAQLSATALLLSRNKLTLLSVHSRNPF